MTITSALVGGGIGFAAQIFSNSIRKIPLSREPWLHVGMFMVGCWAGNLYPKVELKLVQEINELRSTKGLPPMVGTSAWIRYQVPEDETLQIEMKK